MEDYDTKGSTILHLPEAIKLFQHILETFNENYRLRKFDSRHPYLQVCCICLYLLGIHRIKMLIDKYK